MKMRRSTAIVANDHSTVWRKLEENLRDKKQLLKSISASSVGIWHANPFGFFPDCEDFYETIMIKSEFI